MNANKLLDEIIEETNSHIATVEKLFSKTESELNWKENSESWSIFECLEHLNLYGNFYLPEIEKTINNSKFVAENEFKSGILGNYFAKSMLPKEKMNKMKTANDKNPINSTLNKETIETFVSQQTKFIELLKKAKNVNLTKTKTKISISNLIKLRLGDTFRFLNNHTFRHLKQIERIEKHAYR
ncbi:DinB family protein [Myroides sp. JBRI-B21084]|uniref:DinB family protein n=1 Tax=Myroides sp. JBRI-B21084 TaxID=3119977 RepID=UPI00295006FD|nr:DinB family protein [Paenimyroides cloacae]